MKQHKLIKLLLTTVMLLSSPTAVLAEDGAPAETAEPTVETVEKSEDVVEPTAATPELTAAPEVEPSGTSETSEETKEPDTTDEETTVTSETPDIAVLPVETEATETAAPEETAGLESYETPDVTALPVETETTETAVPQETTASETENAGTKNGEKASVIEETTKADGSVVVESKDEQPYDAPSDENSGKDSSTMEESASETEDETGLIAGECDTSLLILQKGDILEAAPFKKQMRRAPSASASTLDYDGAVQTIVSGIRKKQESINIYSYGFTTENILSLFKRIYNSFGDLFYLDRLRYNYSPSDNNRIYTVDPRYLDDYSDADIQRFYNKVDEVLGKMDPAWSDVEKVLYIHDYMVTNIAYDTTRSKYNSYNALIEKSSVCQGYALLFDYFMERLGIPCEVISSRNLNHAWNEVTLDGQNFYVDCTWDDPINDFAEYCKHENLLVDQNKLYSDCGHNTTDWVNSRSETVYGALSSDKYNNYFWKDTYTFIPQIGRKCAYIRHAEGRNWNYVSQFDFTNGTSEDLADNGDDWDRSRLMLSKVSDKYLFSTATAIYTCTPSKVIYKVYQLSSDEKSKGNVVGLRALNEAEGAVRYNVYNGSFSSGDTQLTPAATGSIIVKAGWRKDAKGWWYQNEDRSYPRNAWEKINGAWFYFGADGYMISDKWLTIDGQTYYLKSSGAMAANEYINGWWLNAYGAWTYPYPARWLKGSKGWWYCDTAGWYPSSCWEQIDGYWYYFDDEGWILMNQSRTINGTVYKFDSQGHWIS